MTAQLWSEIVHVGRFGSLKVHKAPLCYCGTRAVVAQHWNGCKRAPTAGNLNAVFKRDGVFSCVTQAWKHSHGPSDEEKKQKQPVPSRLRWRPGQHLHRNFQSCDSHRLT